MKIAPKPFVQLQRRTVLKGILGLTVGAGLYGCGGGGDDNKSTFRVATWLAAQSDLNEDLSPFGWPRPSPSSFVDKTLRQIARASIDGRSPRFKVSNRYGAEPLFLDSARVARSVGGGAIDLATDVEILFAGQRSVTIPPGQERWSDPVAMDLPALAEVAVSFYFQRATVATAHRFSNTISFVGAGDQTRAAVMAGNAGISNGPESPSYYLAEISVERTSPAKVVVAFGDSITDGFGSTPNAYRSWPDQLVTRVQAAKANDSIVNAGIGGNRWLFDRFGTRGVERFKSDVLEVTGVSHVIMLLGTNDFGNAHNFSGQDVSAEQVIDAIRGAVAQARERGIKVYLGTLLPRNASGDLEQKRQAVNSWIRASKDVSGIIDFDKVMQDPSSPVRMPEDWTGDGLHPNDVGYAKMAAAVDLSLF